MLPPPSVTILKTDVTEMLKKYYCFLPAFHDETKVDASKINSTTPTKRVSFVHIPSEGLSEDSTQDTSSKFSKNEKKESTKSESDLETSISDKSIEIKMCTEIEARQSAWPDILKCKYYDI